MTPPGTLRHLRPPRRHRLTPRITEALAEYALHANRKEAATCMGIQLSTFREHLRRAHHAMGCEGTVNTFMALGWRRIPVEATKHRRTAA